MPELADTLRWLAYGGVGGAIVVLMIVVGSRFIPFADDIDDGWSP